MVKKKGADGNFLIYAGFILALVFLFGVFCYYSINNISGELIGKIAGCENCRSLKNAFTAYLGMNAQFTPGEERYYLFRYEKYRGSEGEDLYNCTIDGVEKCFGKRAEIAFPVELSGIEYYFLIHPSVRDNSRCLIKVYEKKRD